MSERRKATLAAWRERNREYLREYHLAWCRAHGQKPMKPMTHGGRYAYRKGCRCDLCVAGERAYQREYRERFPEKERAKQQRFYHAAHGKAHENRRRWQRSPKGKARNLNDQSKRRGAEGFCTPEQRQARIDFWGDRCWMCGGPWDCIDHAIPIARGGTNWPANLRPACTPCNVRKRDRSPKEVMVTRIVA